jgi:hypothetical protein
VSVFGSTQEVMELPDIDFTELTDFAIPVGFMFDAYTTAINREMKILVEPLKTAISFDTSSLGDEHLSDDLWAMVFKNASNLKLITDFHILMPRLFKNVLRKHEYATSCSDFALYFAHPETRLAVSKMQNVIWSDQGDNDKFGILLANHCPFGHLTIKCTTERITESYRECQSEGNRVTFSSPSWYNGIEIRVSRIFVHKVEDTCPVRVRFDSGSVISLPPIVVANCSTLKSYAIACQYETDEFIIPVKYKDCEQDLRSFIELTMRCIHLSEQHYSVESIKNTLIELIQNFAIYQPKKDLFRMMNFANFLGIQYLLEVFAHSLARTMERKSIGELYHEYNLSSIPEEEAKEKAWFLW